MQIATRQADGTVTVETLTPRIAKMDWECEGTLGVRLTLTDNTEVLIHDEKEITQAMADYLACAPYSTQPAAENDKAAKGGMMTKVEAIQKIKEIRKGAGINRNDFIDRVPRGRLAVQSWNDGKFTLGTEYGYIIALVEVFGLAIEDLSSK